MPHDHDHAPIEAQEPDGPYQRLARAAHDLLIEKGFFDAAAVRKMIERIDQRTPALGAEIVARAWTDPAFRDALRTDATRALEEDFGLGKLPTEMIVVENTPDVHNMIVCTLCSCYPVYVLGRPPDWYKSPAYRSRAVREPRAVLREFGTYISDNREIRVHDSTADMRYLVLPMRPEGTEDWDAERLASIVTRDAMVGVAEVTIPG